MKAPRRAAGLRVFTIQPCPVEYINLFPRNTLWQFLRSGDRVLSGQALSSRSARGIIQRDPSYLRSLRVLLLRGPLSAGSPRAWLVVS